jgi:hypothetical protein
VRVSALLPQLRPLQHTEPVLLIDHRQPSRGISIPSSSRAWRPNDDVGASVGGIAANLLLLRCRQRTLSNSTRIARSLHGGANTRLGD